MLDPTLFILAGGGLALGAAVAQLPGPTCWTWEGRAGDLHRRLSCLPRSAPPVVRRAAGAAVLAAVLAGGALAAYAAEPSARPRAAASRDVEASETIAAFGKAPAPPRAAATVPAAPAARGAARAGPAALPSQVAGVIGSGNQLALQLKPVGDAPARILQIGDTFEDGWVLSGLDASTVTLTKAGASRTMGLNPAGTLAAATAGGGSTVTVLAPTRPPPPQGVVDAQAEMARASAAFDAATPETRPALQQALNAARMGVVNAQNDTIRAQTDAMRAQNGLPPLPPPTPPPHYASIAEAQMGLDRATAAFNAATPETREALQQALQTATIALNNTRREAGAAQNAATPAGQRTGQ